MELITSVANGKKVAKVFAVQKGYYQVDMMESGKLVNRVSMFTEERAEQIADEFVAPEGGYVPTLLKE